MLTQRTCFLIAAVAFHVCCASSICKAQASDKEGNSAAGGPGEVPAVTPVGPRQTRVDVFEFSEKPKVVKQDKGYVISFASKAKCDATVAVVDKAGRVVRHLASGVLGDNAPAPFQKRSLSQKLVWDGKTDDGKPAPAGCKVKVGLGLKFTAERNIGYHPAAFADYRGKTTLRGLAVAPDGTLYTFADEQVKCFDREGKYLRTVIPWPGDLPKKKMAGLRLLKTTYGDYSVDAGWKGPLAEFALRGVPTLTPDGKKIVLLSAFKRGVAVKLIGVDGSIKKGASLPLTARASCVAVSPDGQTVYFGCGRNGVLKKAMADLRAPAKRPRRWKGLTLDGFIKGEDSGTVAALVCDKAGNIYVADSTGSRIQVFNPAGSLLKSLPVPKGKKPEKTLRGYINGRPVALAVDSKSGAVYCAVISRLNKWSKFSATLVKFGSLDDPTVKASLNLFGPKGGHTGAFRLAVDSTGDKPLVWVARGGSILRITDKGTSFEQSGSIAPPKGTIQIQDGIYRLIVDRKREELYVSWTGRRIDGHWYRFDGKTGKLDTRFKDFAATDLAIGPDDLIYIRVSFYGRYVVRFDRKFNMVNFPKGRPLPLQRITKWIARQKPTCLSVGGGGSNVWTSGFTVAPNGDIWVAAHEANFKGGIAWVKKNAPWAGKRGEFVEVYTPNGSLKCIDAVVDTGVPTGFRVDREGNLYIVEPNPINKAYGTKRWPFLVTGQTPNDFRAWGKGPGALIKFAAREGGKLPIGKMNGRAPVGMLWGYDGVSGVCGHSCGCLHTRWDLDSFGRAYLPFMQLYSIMIVDANGNTIMRLGRWGNIDSDSGNNIGLVQVKAIAASDNAVYIADTGNKRILKAALGYEVEETIDLAPLQGADTQN